VTHGGRRGLIAVLALVLAIGWGGRAAVAEPPKTPASSHMPVLAYFYQWFSASSWNRAKIDYPLRGRYSSDDSKVIRDQIRAARAAGIDGFIVSWKSSELNDARLEKLIEAARETSFKLVVIYQGLDFDRQPLDVTRVASDFQLFAEHYAHDPVFDVFGKPALIWSGTWEFSAADIDRVTAPLRGKILVLASEKSREGYDRVARSFDGNAYYWSSVDPQTNRRYARKLAEMGAAVHHDGGLWIAPFAPGFDARLVGGTREVPRRNGKTLREEYAAAVSSSPDALGLISWNEFSENTHVEPSERYGTNALTVLNSLTRVQPPPISPLAESSDEQGDGFMTVLVGLAVLLLLLVALGTYRAWRWPPGGSVHRARRVAGSRAPARRTAIAVTGRRRVWLRVLLICVAGLALVSVVAAAVVRQTDSDAGPTPQYWGGQPVRDAKSVIVAAAGDISCPPTTERNNREFAGTGACRMGETATMVQALQPDAVLALGDNQYPSGSLKDFQAVYARNWGRVREITFPVPGNHEYGTPGARGYFDYFGDRAGEEGKGYYSFDLGDWHLVALNSECNHVGGCGPDDPQAAWLRQDLTAHPRDCVLAYWHRPRFSSGNHGDNLDVDPLWQILSAHHAELVLTGHDHDFERFLPMSTSGAPAEGDGMTEMVVGTGGASQYKFHEVDPASRARITGVNGVLKLQLLPASYAWQFQQAPDGQVLDSGSASCH